MRFPFRFPPSIGGWEAEAGSIRRGAFAGVGWIRGSWWIAAVFDARRRAAVSDLRGSNRRRI